MNKKVVIACSVGTLMEWYDYAIYGFLTVPFAKLFFPKEHAIVATLYTYAIFAVGYFARPLGGFSLGYLGDKYGRKWILVVAISLMGLATTLLGLAPTYQQVGPAAPFILLFFRMLQGFAVGSEYMNSAIYLIEEAPYNRRGFFGSMNNVGGGIGCVLGSSLVTLLSFILDANAFLSWGWRIPFFIGTLTAIVGIFIRLKLEESTPFQILKQKELIEPNPLMHAFKTEYKSMVFSFILVLGQSVTFYLATLFFLTWAVSFAHFSYNQALVSTTLSLIFLVFITAISGFLSDLFGRKKILTIGLAGFILFSILIFKVITKFHSFEALILGQSILAGFAALYNGTLPAALAELFHANARCSALTISYNLAAGLLGGSTLFFATYLIKVTQLEIAPAFLLTGASLLSFVFLLFLKETYNKPLKFIDERK